MESTDIESSTLELIVTLFPSQVSIWFNLQAWQHIGKYFKPGVSNVFGDGISYAAPAPRLDSIDVLVNMVWLELRADMEKGSKIEGGEETHEYEEA